MKVNILGTEYTIEYVKIKETEELLKNGFAGSCSNVLPKILVADCTEEEFVGKLTEEEREMLKKKITRHEIIHAFLNESGLQISSSGCEAWADNEEMVDWFAIQSPKIFKAFKDVGCI